MNCSRWVRKLLLTLHFMWIASVCGKHNQLNSTTPCTMEIAEDQLSCCSFLWRSWPMPRAQKASISHFFSQRSTNTTCKNALLLLSWHARSTGQSTGSWKNETPVACRRLHPSTSSLRPASMLNQGTPSTNLKGLNCVFDTVHEP